MRWKFQVERVHLEIGDTALPMRVDGRWLDGNRLAGERPSSKPLAGCAPDSQEEHGSDPPRDSSAGPLPGAPYTEKFSMHAFGAQFAEVRVRADSGEVRVPRLLGVFDVGRMINPKLGRSQLLGGMSWGISMALHEHSVLDPRFGHVVNNDFAGYHIATIADVGTVEVHWLDVEDPNSNPMGAKGIGELGIVGTAAAIANAVYHATGVRIRDLPITLDKLL